MSVLIPKYLAFDIESGGLGIEHTLLTAYFAIVTSDFKIITGLSLATKPPKGSSYVVQPEALAVNKIDLITHHKTAMSCEDASTVLYNFLKANSSYKLTPEDPEVKVKLTPLGHNILAEDGDIAYIQKYLLSKKSWTQFVSHKAHDTLVIAEYLKSKGQLPSDMSTALHNLATYYNIPFPGMHTAIGDTIVNIQVAARM